MSRKHFKASQGLHVSPVSSRPADAENGDMIYNQTLNQFEKYENGAWTSFSGSSSTALVPTGAVLPFAGTAAPSGYVLCQGAEVDRTVFANLFAVIGTAHGAGNGSTTFNLPDYRGRFLRGTDNAVGRDPNAGVRTSMNSGGNTGDNVGSIQGDSFTSHQHIQGYGSSVSPAARYGSVSGLASARVDYYTAAATDGTDGALVSSTGGAETRPINAYINYIIKV